MTKMTMLLFAALLIIPMALAQQPDTNTMTTEQLQEYIRQLQQAGQPQQTTVTIQVEEKLQQDLEMMIEEIKALKEANTRMEERFGMLVTDTDQKIKESEARSVDKITQNIAKFFETQDINFREFVAMYTNPVRTNLPIIGVFMMLTGAFLLWASRQYELTEGARKRGY